MPISDRTPGPWVVIKRKYRPWFRFWAPEYVEYVAQTYYTWGPADCYADAFGGVVRKATTEEAKALA